jgi:hypothetical protein
MRMALIAMLIMATSNGQQKEVPAKEKASAKLSAKSAVSRQIEGYSVGPLFIKDEPCVRDYAKALSLGGLEGRKMLDELLMYGCIEKLGHIYDAYGGKLIEAGVLPGQSPDTDHWILKGFIAEDVFLKISEQEMKDLVERAGSRK